MWDGWCHTSYVHWYLYTRTDSGRLRDVRSCLVTGHVWLQAMLGYRLCLETLNIPFKNIKGCGWGCRETFLY